ncbi:VOC family protein [Oceanisphaera avium]|uniref:VOC family virulence protein n=1 Tax=Oceanisphaera avium TaxID=1903694 RepID=A0A1Y0CXC9_9GAMM|nr:VOC family protein [Oceanisphaera avium]ART79962.1 VOC family virulence protein [Oceanisphaera avium]
MSAFEVLGLDHLVLRVRQPMRMLDFYCRVLGCQLEREVAELGLYQLRAGSQLIDLVDIQGPLGGDGQVPDQCKANLDHFCLLIAPFEVEALYQYLAKNAVIYERASQRFGAQGEGLSVYVYDPEGNQVELKGASDMGSAPAPLIVQSYKMLSVPFKSNVVFFHLVPD